MKNLPIDALNLDTQTENTLKASGYLSVGALMQADLPRLPGIGNARHAHILKALATMRPAGSRDADAPTQREALAVQLVAAMVNGTTGDVGGHSQARMFAEIAFDFLDAIQTEAASRDRLTRDANPPA